MGTGSSHVVRALGAIKTKNNVTRLTKHQLGLRMSRALRYDVTPLSTHQIEKLVDDEAGREADHPSSWNGDSFSADGTPERSDGLPLGINDVLQATEADGVGAREELGSSFFIVVDAQASAAGEEAVAEVIVVDGDCLDQRGRH